MPTLFSDTRSPSGTLGSLMRLTSPMDPIVLTFLCWYYKQVPTTPSLLDLLQGSNLVPHAHMTNVLQTELSPQLRLNMQSKYGLSELAWSV